MPAPDKGQKDFSLVSMKSLLFEPTGVRTLLRMDSYVEYISNTIYQKITTMVHDRVQKEGSLCVDRTHWCVQIQHSGVFRSKTLVWERARRMDEPSIPPLTLRVDSLNISQEKDKAS